MQWHTTAFLANYGTAEQCPYYAMTLLKKTYIMFNYTCHFVWMWNLVFHAEDILAQTTQNTWNARGMRWKDRVKCIIKSSTIYTHQTWRQWNQWLLDEMCGKECGIKHNASVVSIHMAEDKDLWWATGLSIMSTAGSWEHSTSQNLLTSSSISFSRTVCHGLA
jgi:hypothetical protein